MPDSPEGHGSATERERIAREALLEITPEETIGEPLGELPEAEGAITVRFASNLDGYPGWHWSVGLAQLPGESPTVLETELMPGEGALLAPDWVPWSDRLEDYRLAQAAAGETEADAETDDDDLEDDGDLDEDDDDDLIDDDDLEDEVDDGIEFELDDDSAAVPPMGVEQADEAEAEADEDGPEPPDVAPVKKRRKKEQQPAEDG